MIYATVPVEIASDPELRTTRDGENYCSAIASAHVDRIYKIRTVLTGHDDMLDPLMKLRQGDAVVVRGVLTPRVNTHFRTTPALSISLRIDAILPLTMPAGRPGA